MNADATRRTLLGGSVAAGTMSPIRGYLERFAAVSGTATGSLARGVV